MKSKDPSDSAERPQAGAVLECPTCLSHRAEVLHTEPIHARCFDCKTIYRVKTVKPHADIDLTDDDSQQKQPASARKRKTKADYRAEIAPAPPLSEQELGPNTVFMRETLQATPEEIAQAEHKARKMAQKFGEEFEARWFLETEYLRNLKTINRTRARYALQWRPKFLAALALGRSMVFASKAAKVAYMTPRNHRLLDPDFNRQCEEAIDYATELLETRAFQRALEGDCEPIVYMGVVVGHVKKFDSRLQIELLRAYRPERFKTPGTQVNIAAKNDVFVLTEEQRHELIRINREYLLTTPIPTDSVAASSPKELRNENPETSEQTP